MDPVYFRIHPSPFGRFVIVWSKFRGLPRILQIIIPAPDQSTQERLFRSFPDSEEGSCIEIDSTTRKLAGFLSGQDTRFSLGLIRLDRCTVFQRDVLRAEYGIPRGRVSTYQRIAKYLRIPEGARAVGSALARNPFPIIIPCHRAVRSDGTLGGYQGGASMKRRLLEMEGIRFDNEGNVITDRFFY
jgi:methylated-DNA-[protein]-cysteine S-methyltransferase